MALPRDDTRHLRAADADRDRLPSSDLPGEVFGPVLHVLRYRREDMEAVVRAVNATGFGLTFGVQSRIDETIERATAASAAGNQYVNRNMIGAVVGVQPFGGHGLSGTGPKAGGPLYVLRLLSQRPSMSRRRPVSCRVRSASATPTASGRRARSSASRAMRRSVRPSRRRRRRWAIASPTIPQRRASSPHCSPAARKTSARSTSAWPRATGPIVPVYVAPYPVEFLGAEVSLSVNTAAAGGNASLMTIG